MYFQFLKKIASYLSLGTCIFYLVLCGVGFMFVSLVCRSLEQPMPAHFISFVPVVKGKETLNFCLFVIDMSKCRELG